MSHPPGHYDLTNSLPTTPHTPICTNSLKEGLCFILGGDSNWNPLVNTRGNFSDKSSHLAFPQPINTVPKINLALHFKQDSHFLPRIGSSLFVSPLCRSKFSHKRLYYVTVKLESNFQLRSKHANYEHFHSKSLLKRIHFGEEQRPLISVIFLLNAHFANWNKFCLQSSWEALHRG